MDVEASQCHRCGQPAHCFEIGVDDAHAYCGLVCQTAQRGRIRLFEEDCARKLRQFRLTALLGFGADGVVFAFVSANYGEGALKIVAGTAVEEVLASARLTGLYGFVALYDYWICQQHNGWTDPVILQAMAKDAGIAEILGPSGQFTCLAMQRAAGTLIQLQVKDILSANEEWQFHFELVFALHEAFQKMGFRHGDTRSRNIFYVASAPRQYALGDGSVLRCTSPFRPLWGDFGQSSFDNEWVMASVDMGALSIAMELWGKIEPWEVREVKRYSFAGYENDYSNWLLRLAQKIRET